jgi:hypothetical protein
MSARRPLSGKPDIAADMAVGPLLTPIRTLARDAGAPCWCWRSSSHLDSERFRPVQRTCGPLLWQAQRAVADCGGVKPMSGMRRRQFMTLLGGRGGRAARGAGAAGRADAAHRRPLKYTRGRSATAGSARRLRAAADGTGLDRQYNARLDVRWTAGSVDAARKYAAELVALAPGVIITDTSFNVACSPAPTR